LHGALLVDKPAGVTSHDVVAQVRRERGERTGHAGTLDPFATGLLIILLGRATRLQRYVLPLPKTYVATARLGWRSTTGDPDGELSETGRLPDRLELPTGEIEQSVPMTSAVKVGGERLYRKARRGEEVETPTRAVSVYRADLLDRDSERARFEIECSSGTYVRTLIETLEDAYCESLRRTAIGPFSVPDDESREIAVEDLMGFLPERALDADEAARVANGRAVKTRRPPGPPSIEPTPSGSLEGEAGDRPQRVRLTDGHRLVAIARPEGDQLKPEVVLA
jgi:tRNA pseudouridine55 synthase